MDNRKTEQLAYLYDLLVKTKQLTKTNTKKILNVSSILLDSMVLQLREMGLKIDKVDDKLYLKNHAEKTDSDQLRIQLKKSGILTPLHVYFSTSSTNEMAMQNKKCGIFVSEHQSSGHGRRNKSWLSPLGQSICLSVSHDFDFSLQQLSGLNIAIAVAFMQTVATTENIGLKWPNDVIGSQGKIAGILIEASGNSQTCRAIIGIGINWSLEQSLLKIIDQPCQNIPKQGVSKTLFIAKLITKIMCILSEFENNKLKNILPLWNKHDSYKNKTINLIQENTSQKAQYLGVDCDGLLGLTINGEKKLIANGEVSIRKVD